MFCKQKLLMKLEIEVVVLATSEWRCRCFAGNCMRYEIGCRWGGSITCKGSGWNPPFAVKKASPSMSYGGEIHVVVADPNGRKVGVWRIQRRQGENRWGNLMWFCSARPSVHVRKERSGVSWPYKWPQTRGESRPSQRPSMVLLALKLPMLAKMFQVSATLCFVGSHHPS